MGKQTKRQRAKKAQEAATVDAPMPEATLCCLPHCGEPGEKLECGHPLCEMDFLKLARYVSQLKQFAITCPMCRKWGLLDEKLVVEAMGHLPFKSAVFKCGCVEKDCERSFTGVLKPCKSHGNHTCGVCVGKKASTLNMIDSQDSESSDSESSEPDWTTPGWGITDDFFEQALRTMPGMDGTLVGLYRNDRRLGRPPGEPLAYNTPGWGMSDARFEEFLQLLKQRIDLNEGREQETRTARQEGRFPNYSGGLAGGARARSPLITIPMSEAGPMMDRGARFIIPRNQADDFMRAVNAARR